MKIYVCSDVGNVRPSNQDTYFIGRFSENHNAWAVVCDGMGGNAGGNIASSLASKAIGNSINSSFRNNMKPVQIKSVFLSAFSLANANIYDFVKNNPEYEGMGTTAVSVITNDDTAFIANIGDSRAYLIRKNSIEQVTTDHSYVQELVDAGVITKDEARVHPHRNLITRALGTDYNTTIDFTIVDYSKDDKLLLCTDGLSGFLTDEQILNIASDDTITNPARVLVEMAMSVGSTDNVTAVLISD